MSNEIVKKPKQEIGFTSFMTSGVVQKKVNEILGDEKRGARFISSIVSAVNSNPTLKECDNSSILSGALLGEALSLSPSPTLGRMYLVPFQDKNRGMVAQFILGYKGYLELAMRSGQYKDINVMEIREGEYKGRNKENGNPTFEFIEDDDEREKKKIIGYMASFTLVNGFTKTIYKTQKQMEEHALQYSNGYRSDKKKGTAYTFWSKDFTSMAFKTLLRQLISRWGIMSIELQQAYDGDMAVINEDGTRDYVDNQAKDVSFEIVEQPKEVKGLDDID
jgi:recombination protein RecT